MDLFNPKFVTEISKNVQFEESILFKSKIIIISHIFECYKQKYLYKRLLGLGGASR